MYCQAVLHITIYGIFAGEISSRHVAANIHLDLPVKRSSVFNFLAKEEFLDIEVSFENNHSNYSKFILT